MNNASRILKTFCVVDVSINDFMFLGVGFDYFGYDVNVLNLTLFINVFILKIVFAVLPEKQQTCQVLKLGRFVL
ncbi:MAG: hypothetical protein ACJAWV_002642 [Flammeovirgaceae bacterium]|jgi:hypothetical protein